MTRMLILAAVATVAVAAAVTPAEARWWGPPIFVAPPPVYVGPACHVRRERICDPWGCRVRRIEDCY